MPASGKNSAAKNRAKSGKGMAKAKNVTGQQRSGLIFAPSRCNRYLKQGRYSTRYGSSAGVFMAGVLQYLSEEILDLTATMCNDHKKKTISPKHLNLALRSDPELSKMMYLSQISEGGMLVQYSKDLFPDNKKKGEKASQQV